MSAILIRPIIKQDIPQAVSLSYHKRRLYEKAQPQFWKYAGPQAEEKQAQWFETLLDDDGYLMLTALCDNKMVGFVIGKMIAAPEVYDPGGLTLMIDDFCVDLEDNWPLVGGKLLEAIKDLAKVKNVGQILVVCGAHDAAKGRFLKDMNLMVASHWYVGENV